tara:strand:- start:335 stop:541 length:207 start_codon:yes stop_codon:yes gene_type:complete
MRFVLVILSLFFSISGLAQSIEMADQMRANGKIYVVVAVLLIILIGLLVYLISIDRKVSRLEKNSPKK